MTTVGMPILDHEWERLIDQDDEADKRVCGVAANHDDAHQQKCQSQLHSGLLLKILTSLTRNMIRACLPASEAG